MEGSEGGEGAEKRTWKRRGLWWRCLAEGPQGPNSRALSNVARTAAAETAPAPYSGAGQHLC